MNAFRLLYKLSFLIITLITFVFGGVLQYLLGISNTVITLFIVFFIYSTYILYVFLKRKVIFNNVVKWTLLYIVLITISAIINHSSLIATLIYFIFPALPLGVFLFCFINSKEGIISKNYIYKLFYYIALLQLPVLLIQKNFYSFLIQFNNSGQKIDWYDFMFGTFFIKSDHSLALFIIFIILVILINKNNGLFKQPLLSVFYLTATVFLTESNISKLFLVIILLISFIIPVYNKYKNRSLFKLTVVILGVFIGLFIYELKNEDFIKNRLGGDFEKQYSLETAEKRFDLGDAKRLQIVIVAYKKLDLKWIGGGPYSYFNILTGEFAKTRHFTQLIWTYFDLGIIGLLAVIGFLFSIIKNLNIQRGIPYYGFLLMFFIYALYTTIFSDIAIMFSIIILFSKQKINEFNNNTIS